MLSNIILYVEGRYIKRIRELKNTISLQNFFQNINIHLNSINHPLHIIFSIKIAKLEHIDRFI
jgi:hypothetical protein